MPEGLKNINFTGLKPAATDSFSACLAVASDYWNRDFDYNFMAGITGSAFSPGWSVREDCVAWWMEAGLPQRLEFVGRVAGFFVNESPEMSRDENNSNCGVSDEILKFRGLVRSAVNDGEIVIVWSWPMWSIIKKWDDDLNRIELATLHGPAGERTIVGARSKMYILNPGPPELAIYDALKEAMKFGSSVANGDIDTPLYKYGGSLYSEIIKNVGNRIFCEPCGSKSWTCLLRTMWRVSGLNKTCSEFLEFAGMFLGKSIPKHELERTIHSYRELSKIAEKYLDPDLLKEKIDQPGFRAMLKTDVGKMQDLHKSCGSAMRIIASEIN